MLFKFVILLPLAALFLCWFFGNNPALRLGFLTLAAWWSAIVVIIFTRDFETHGLGDLLHVVFLFILLLVGPLVGTLVAILFGKPSDGPSPATQVCDAYKGLPPEQKEKLHRGARTAAKFGFKLASEYLRNKDNKIFASVLRNAGKML